MKATGIVRRIDDLGRVAIPKGIRHAMGLKGSEPLEIYINNDCICFRRYRNSYSLINDINRLCDQVKDYADDIGFNYDSDELDSLFAPIVKQLQLMEDGEP